MTPPQGSPDFFFLTSGERDFGKGQINITLVQGGLDYFTLSRSGGLGLFNPWSGCPRYFFNTSSRRGLALISASLKSFFPPWEGARSILPLFRGVCFLPRIGHEDYFCLTPGQGGRDSFNTMSRWGLVYYFCISQKKFYTIKYVQISHFKHFGTFLKHV